MSAACSTYSEQIPFYVYGELTPDREETFEQHCASCSGCSEELDRYRKMMAALDAARLPVPADLLGECRYALAQALDSEAASLAAAGRVRGSWLSHATIGFRVPVGAMALVALGFFGAKISPDLGLHAAQAGLMNVRSVQTDSSGQVQIAVDDTRRKIVSGSVDDPNIRKLLIDALHDTSNAGVRVESADMLKDHCALADVRDALTDRLLNDPNPGVRLKAMDGLKRFSSDPEVRKTLTSVLVNDVNPGVRIQAIDLLTAQRDESLVGVLQTVMQKEDNQYVRLKVRNALEDMRASVGTF
jgi:hypothetical protein